MATIYEQALLDFAGHIGLPSPETLLDTQELVIGTHTVGFSFDADDINEPVAGDILFFCKLGSVTADKQADLFRLLLEANNLWNGTGGAILGLQRDTDIVTLAARLPLEALQASHLATVLEAFIDTADFWSGVIAGDFAFKKADVAMHV